MKEQNFQSLINSAIRQVRELFPWDLEELLQARQDVLLVDIREANEVEQGMIANSLHVPRGLLEAACSWGYSDTVPALVKARQQPVILVCRSGNRSVLAALTLQLMGYENVYSLKTGIRGWNDYELPLVTPRGERVDIDAADIALSPPIRAEQMPPQ